MFLQDNLTYTELTVQLLDFIGGPQFLSGLMLDLKRNLKEVLETNEELTLVNFACMHNAARDEYIDRGSRRIEMAKLSPEQHALKGTSRVARYYFGLYVRLFLDGDNFASSKGYFCLCLWCVF